MMDSTPLHKLIGLLASAGITAVSTVADMTPHIDAVPHWATIIREWSLIVGAPIGVLGMAFYAVSMMLDNRRKFRVEREAARQELHEIEDAKCKARQANGQCPKLRK